MSELRPSRRGIDAPAFLRGLNLGERLAKAILYITLGFVLGLLCGCSTANNYKLPPWEVERRELTCDRKTTGLPHGLVCVCRQFGSTWDCQVARIE